ncbi:MAG: septation regulator SpoVG [Myxococcaceae bacterium]
MNITDVKVFLVDEDKLRAYVTITLDRCFVVRDLKVIQGSTGLFVAMPAKKKKDGTYKDIAHPLNAEMRSVLEARVLAEYEASARNAMPRRTVDREGPQPDTQDFD